MPDRWKYVTYGFLGGFAMTALVLQVGGWLGGGCP